MLSDTQKHNSIARQIIVAIKPLPLRPQASPLVGAGAIESPRRPKRIAGELDNLKCIPRLP